MLGPPYSVSIVHITVIQIQRIFQFLCLVAAVLQLAHVYISFHFQDIDSVVIFMIVHVNRRVNLIQPLVYSLYAFILWPDPHHEYSIHNTLDAVYWDCTPNTCTKQQTDNLLERDNEKIIFTRRKLTRVSFPTLCTQIKKK